MKRLLAGVILALALVNPVSAKVTTSITLDQADPHLGGPATFTIVIDKNKDCTNKSQCGFVNLACSQAGVVVYAAGPVTIAEARSPGFVLGYTTNGTDLFPSQWALNGGPATCSAEIDNFHFGVVYASTTFIAAG